jgi:multiple sugar transport system ATP-binding protein
MHDGIVEQIGTPLELFDKPGNLFVAQFIGSPSMNVMNGTLKKSGGTAYVDVAGQLWPVAAGAGGVDGQAVSYGVRPGDLSISENGQASAHSVAATVIVVEPTGAETELLLQVGEHQLVLVMHGRTSAQPDEVVHLNVDTDKTHLFDATSGIRLG